MLKHDLSEMHFDQEYAKTQFQVEIEPVIKREMQYFFNLGMVEKSSHVRPILETLESNVNNPKLSNRDFRDLVETIIPILKKTLI